ncbi:DnaJ like protein subfamily C member 7 [Strigomonas culicis]|uniref:DnaJ like protein subfamily C member 7 n=1 Tax=Strigomonas culicis TaxID=28005 RepID=S9VCE5_9TRYP|nr:DnaJ like protein subfamily C member 7 [Strigomonas culicis]EPY24226.1 DnaJ like protein subfamily C member 7 [Strigomonas culicis]|eukprot:EPY20745.1 DnaJ like protein subfamily C member 7 [Strigomonas culicis]
MSVDEEDSVAETWESLKEKGNQEFKNKSYEAAVNYYSKAIDLNPSEAVLFSNRSAAYLQKGSYAEAAADARVAVQLDKCFCKAYTRLHTALCNLGEFGEAVAALQEGLQHVVTAGNATPQEVANLRELIASATEAKSALDRAKQMVERDTAQEAVRLLRGPLKKFPDCPAIAFLFARCCAPSSPDEANEALKAFAYSHSSDTLYLYLRALVFYYRGQDGFKSAQTILREVLGMDPDNSDARILLKKIRHVESKKEEGNAAFKEKRSRDAVEAYSSAIDFDPSNTRMSAVLRGNRAAARMDLNDFKGALMDCEFAMSNGGSSAKLFARRSRIQERLENYEDAVRDMQEAAQQDRSFEAELNHLKARAKKARRKDYYKTLGLPQNESNADTIKRAYKRACLQWHPDKWAHASEEEKTHAEKEFKEIGEAFGVLSDPQKKRMYDSGMMDNDVEGANQHAGGFGGGEQDIANMMNMMFGGGGGGAGFTFGGFPQGGDPFGGGGARRSRRGRGGMPQGFYRF